MKHWIGALLLAAALALAGWAISPECSTSARDADNMAGIIGNGLLGLGGVIAVIALFKLASELMSQKN